MIPKTKIYSLGQNLIFVALLSAIFFFAPSALAQYDSFSDCMSNGPGNASDCCPYFPNEAQCQPTNTGGTGTANACAGVTCIPGCTCVTANGGICVLSSDNSKPCTTTSSGGSGNGGVVPPPPPAGGGSSAVCEKKNCPEGLCSVNGLCLPPNQFNTGIAGSTTLVDLLTKIIQLLLTFAGIIAVVMLVIGGYWYMAAGGNEEMAEKGKKTIINFVLGLVVILLAYMIVTILSNTLTADKFTR